MHFPHHYRTMAGKPGGSDGMPPNYSQDSIGFVLYNLREDIGQRKNLAQNHPERVRQMQALLKEIRESGHPELVNSGSD